MATLETDNGDVVVRLSRLEKLGAFRRSDPRAPLAKVTEIRAVENGWTEVRGMRAPGTGIPGVIMLGTTRRRGGKDFDAIYRRGLAVVIEFKDAAWGRFAITHEDAWRIAAKLQQELPD
jgi:hypothetical protein